MIFAPHPDDESLPAGILLQRAIASGAEVRVVYATDGENNPWPQRVWARRWNLTSVDRSRWRKFRRKEARRALQIMGVSPRSAQFLALPDQGLTRLLMDEGVETASALARVIDEWQPTHLLAPSIADTHPDHSALAILLNFAVALVAPDSFAMWSYLVHGNRRKFAATATEVDALAEQIFRKRKAIECHKTQLILSRRRLLAYARRLELFQPETAQICRKEAGALRLVGLRGDTLSLSVLTPRNAPRRRTYTLHVVARDRRDGLISWKLQVKPRRGIIDECRGGHRVFTQRDRSPARPYELMISTDQFDLSQPIFVKLAVPSFGIYDSGWLEVRAGGIACYEGEKMVRGRGFEPPPESLREALQARSD